MKKLLCKILGHDFETIIDFEDRKNDKLKCLRCGKTFNWGNMSIREYKNFKRNQNID